VTNTYTVDSTSTANISEELQYSEGTWHITRRHVAPPASPP
jgi:hypothetical protein